MSNHVHLILSAAHGNLSDVLRDCKAYISRTMMRAIQEEPESRRNWLLLLAQYAAKGHNCNVYWQLWQHENHAVNIPQRKILPAETRLYP